MLPLVFGGLILSGLAIGWICDQMTAEERRRQQEALDERDRYQREFQHTRNGEYQEFAARQQQLAEACYQTLSELIAEHRKKITPITDTLSALFALISQEIKAESTSPFRRSALNREFARIEDARTRLTEYQRYLDQQQADIDRLRRAGHHRRLIDCQPAAALLPVEWLYAGKLVMVEQSDLNANLPGSGHRLQLSNRRQNGQRQLALALEYGDSFPVLIEGKSAKSQTLFFGCVAKGIAFHDYIIPAKPAEMRVTGGNKTLYRGELFNGLLAVTLPVTLLHHPGINLVTGQTVSVWFERFDACLNLDPASASGAGSRPMPVVMSQTPPAMAGYENISLCLSINEKLLEELDPDDSFYHPRQRWTLIDYDAAQRQLTLGRGNVQVFCQPGENLDQLVVSELLQTGEPQIGVDMPFELLLVADHLDPAALFGWRFGLELLLSFASQAMVDAEVSRRQLDQLAFFRQWQQVIEYQRHSEYQSQREFSAQAVCIQGERQQQIQLTIPLIADDDDNAMLDFWRGMARNDRITLHQCIELEIWCGTRGRFMPLLHQGKRRELDAILQPDNRLLLEAICYLLPDVDLQAEQRYRFTLSLPADALMRQQQALKDLFAGKMANPALKPVLLAPEHYQGQSLSWWGEETPQWRSALTASQQHTIDKALSARHIAMIQGPPGTGKTTVIVEMLYQLLQRNPQQRILVVSQQNTAVDNALSRFKDRFGAELAGSVNLMRIGNPERVDEELSEDHIDRVYQRFIQQLQQHGEAMSHQIADERQPVLYQWMALLKQLQARQQDKKPVSDEFFSVMMANINLLGATCVGLAARKAGLDNMVFDTVIIDEAGRATVPELLIPLLRARKAILIGDHHQLPPSVSPLLREEQTLQALPFLASAFFETSFFERLYNSLPASCTASLQEQFRMAAPIGDLIAELFYSPGGERRLFNGRTRDDAARALLSERLLWVDIAGNQEKAAGETSLSNQQEAQAMARFLRTLAGSITREAEVAVITPYSAQKKRIQQLLRQGSKETGALIRLGRLTIKVDTVDSFQGSEADLVCYSTVRTSGSLQFVLDRKRLNVACSRAKENLVFFGKRRYLQNYLPPAGEVNLFAQILARTQIIREHEISRLMICEPQPKVLSS